MPPDVTRERVNIHGLDDQLTWGILPARMYLQSHMTRWTLGASDIMFTNPVFSAFFRKGETFSQAYTSPQSTPRSKSCAWIHLFAEGKWGMCVPPSPHPNMTPTLRRLTFSPRQRPCHSGDPASSHNHLHVDNRGFDGLIPEGRHVPWKYLPRPGATFGAPVSPAAVVARGLRL
ncbi:hypothetical protein EDB86DRAFT_3087264 [Lactarius hatsudake]|nr:hypothetical protein EDB86DRAFT_3087264 [Lactarius hatsudake]